MEVHINSDYMNSKTKEVVRIFSVYASQDFTIIVLSNGRSVDSKDFEENYHPFVKTYTFKEAIEALEDNFSRIATNGDCHLGIRVDNNLNMILVCTTICGKNSFDGPTEIRTDVKNLSKGKYITKMELPKDGWMLN